MKMQTSKVSTLRHRAAVRIKKDIVAWMLILPSVILFTVFFWQPIVSSIYLSFFKTAGFEAVNFVGLTNYVKVFNNASFITALKNSCKYVFWSIVFGVPMPIIASILLNEIRRGKSLFRMGVYFPCMVPGIATAFMWATMMDPSSTGLFNIILSKIGLEPYQWLQDSSKTIPLIVMTMTWRGFGSTAILYLANLQSVNNELYEAASLDGAGVMRKLFHVTLPHMRGLIKILVVMQLINVFKVFQEPLAMTSGGPGEASVSLALISYQYAFNYFQVDRSVAMSVIICILLSIFTAIYFKITKEEE